MMNALTRQQVSLAQYSCNMFNVTVPANTDPESMLNPALWQLVAQPNNMSPGDEVRVIADDCSWVMRAIVSFRKGAQVHLRKESLTQLTATSFASDAVSDDRFIVEHRGPKGGWCVIDTKAENEDAMKVAKGLESREEAEAELKKLMAVA